MEGIQNKQAGFNIVELLVIVVAVGVIGAGGWFIYQHNRVKLTGAATGTQPTNQSTNPANTTPAPATTVVKIPELGIQLTVPDSIKDLTYKVGTATLNDGRQETYAEFSTASLAAADTNCGTDSGPLGSLAKISGQFPTSFSDSNPPMEYGSLVKQFPTFFISEFSPQAACATAAASGSAAAAASNQNAASTDRAALNSSLSTIQATN